MILLTDWNVAWLMTGIGIGVVFCILIALVIVLQIFDHMAKKTGKKDAGAKQASLAKVPVADKLAQASELDKAAIATAIYLYQKSKGDQESGVLTIHHAPSAWHAVLNERL